MKQHAQTASSPDTVIFAVPMPCKALGGWVRNSWAIPYSISTHLWCQLCHHSAAVLCHDTPQVLPCCCLDCVVLQAASPVVEVAGGTRQQLDGWLGGCGGHRQGRISLLLYKHWCANDVVVELGKT
jgi:hypothetical protein